MRLVRSVQFALGFATVGGAFMLSGSALAADSSLVTNTQSSTLTSTHQIDRTSQSTTNNQSGSIVPSVGPTDGKGNGPTVIGTGGNSGLTGLGFGSGSATDTNSMTQQVGPVAITSGSSTDGTMNAGGSVGPIDTTGPGNSSNVSNSNLTAQPESLAPISPTQIQSSQPKATSSIKPVVVYNSRILPVQPTMLNPMVGPAGLSPIVLMPIVPAPAKSPVPPKPDGLLVSLTQLLGATVVPVSYTPTLGAVYLAGIVLSLITLAVLLCNLVIVSYGLWLKRSGFVTAARSDAPLVAIVSMIFATPYSLGYAPASPHSHNPSFMVADQKTRTNWFTTL